jgi:acyl dehydratase
MHKVEFEAPKPLFFEDFEEGAELAPATKGPMLVGHQVRWAGACDNYHHEFHHDEYVAKAQGMPGILLSGPLMASLLFTEVARWFGANARIVRFFDRNSAHTMPRDLAHIRGIVKRKYEEAGRAMVEIECWIENQNGVKTTPGGATAELPRRSA